MPDQAQHNILIADDNETNRRVIDQMLRHKGYAPVVVGSGEAAIEALERSNFHLLILDCVMPGMDGFETARRIRKRDSEDFNFAIPILAITALASPEDRDQCLEAGMNDYISKPFRAESLFARVEALISGHEPTTEPDDGWTAGGAADNAGSGVDLQRIVRDMSGTLVRDASAWKSQLRTALEQERWEDLRILAHKIRGTADIVDCRPLSTASAALEKSAALADARAARVLTGEVVADLQRLVDEVASDD